MPHRPLAGVLTALVLSLVPTVAANADATSPAVPATVDRFEPDDTSAQAARLTPPASITASVASADDQDWYAFSAALPLWMIRSAPAVEGIDVSVSSTTPHCLDQFTVTVFGPGLPAAGDPDSPEIPVTGGGQYLVRVTAGAAGGCAASGGYRLELAWHDLGATDVTTTTTSDVKRTTCDYYAGQIRFWRSMTRAGNKAARAAAARRLATEVLASRRYGGP
ncbi:MAG: hypothetical protein AAGC46_16785 [Solirubrobacteraceae bacterium]|nr:hypothetical protein [Patulibacter sp.]